MNTIDTDVVVIGSGFGGAALALRLARAGLAVRVLERGAAIGPGQSRALLRQSEEFRQTQDPQYILKYIKGVASEHLHLTYAEALGGGSGFYEMASFRAPSLAFRQRDRHGLPLWPAGIDRNTLDPWYDQAEKMLRIEQVAPQDVPKSGLVFSLLMKNLGYSCERGRYAVQNCMGSGFCATGCIYGAKQSLHLNYLTEAVNAGASIECDVDAIEVSPVLDGLMGNGAMSAVPLRYAVRCRRRTGIEEPFEIRARIVAVAGGTVGTAALLLRSKQRLHHVSAQLGDNIAFNGSVKSVGLLGDHFPDGDMFTGRSHPGMISYEFLESRGVTVSAAKAMPIAAVSSARLRLDGDPGDDSWWGEANVELMRQFRRRVIALVSFGLTPPDGRIIVDAGGKPVLQLDPTPELAAYERDTRALLESIFIRNGCRVVNAEWLKGDGSPHAGLFFSTAHQTGSARMADSPRRGVVDAAGEVFGHPGLYVSDGAAIPSSLAVNTSLTILANAERIAAGILARYRLESASPIAVSVRRQSSAPSAGSAASEEGLASRSRS